MPDTYRLLAHSALPMLSGIGAILEAGAKLCDAQFLPIVKSKKQAIDL